MFKVLDLFSGIGGFSLGLERAGFETIAFCEIEPFCRAVLRKHWPTVPCYEDIQELTGERLAVDGLAPAVLCGGFPCQDLSRAGSRLGLKGERSGLWREYARLIDELRPRYILVENVADLLEWEFGEVLSDLARSGYDVEWSVLRACAMGAPHMRRRVFVVAYPNGLYGSTGIWDTAARTNWALQENNSFPGARADWRTRLANPSALYGGANGLPAGLDRNRGIGNAVVPIIPERIGRMIVAAENVLSSI